MARGAHPSKCFLLTNRTILYCWSFLCLDCLNFNQYEIDASNQDLEQKGLIIREWKGKGKKFCFRSTISDFTQYIRLFINMLRKERIVFLLFLLALCIDICLNAKVGAVLVLDAYQDTSVTRDDEFHRALSEQRQPLFRGQGTHYVFLWVGSPPQRVSVIVDTGSHHTAFPCVGCKCGKHVSSCKSLVSFSC